MESLSSPTITGKVLGQKVTASRLLGEKILQGVKETSYNVNQLRQLILETCMICKPLILILSVHFSSSHELLHMFELTSVSAVSLILKLSSFFQYIAC